MFLLVLYNEYCVYAGGIMQVVYYQVVILRLHVLSWNDTQMLKNLDRKGLESYIIASFYV